MRQATLTTTKRYLKDCNLVPTLLRAQRIINTNDMIDRYQERVLAVHIAWMFDGAEEAKGTDRINSAITANEISEAANISFAMKAIDPGEKNRIVCKIHQIVYIHFAINNYAIRLTLCNPNTNTRVPINFQPTSQWRDRTAFGRILDFGRFSTFRGTDYSALR